MKAKSLFFAALAIMMAACVPTEDPKDEFVPEFKVSGVKDNTISVGASGKDVTVSVTSNLSWSIDCQSDWVSVDPASYTAKEDKTSETVKVKVSVLENDVEEAREATLTIAGEGVDPVAVTVKQAAKEHVYQTICVFDFDNYAEVADYSITAVAAPSEISFYVKATADWKAECSEWITVSPDSFTYSDGNETVKVTASFTKNYGEERTGEIKFSGDFETDLVIPVTQKKLDSVELTIGDVTFEAINFSAVPSDKEMLYIVTYDTPEYVNQFDNDEDFFASEIEFFQYLATEYKMTLEAVIAELASTGDVEDYFSVDPDTDVVVYAFGLTSDGSTLLTPIVKCAAKTDALKFAGTAIWHDTMIDELFGLTDDGYNVDLPCDVYTYDKAPGHYYFHSPYNFANIAGWFDITPEELYPYNANWTDVYIDLDCSDANAVVYPLQAMGCSLSPNNYGWFLAGGTYQPVEFNSTGVLAGDTITFADPLLIGMVATEKIYKVNTAEDNKFNIKIDFNATESVYPSIPEQNSVSSVKGDKVGKSLRSNKLSRSIATKEIALK